MIKKRTVLLLGAGAVIDWNGPKTFELTKLIRESGFYCNDNKGKLVLSGKIIAENTVIELGNLSGGIYLFSVGENLKQTFKVIKE